MITKPVSLATKEELNSQLSRLKKAKHVSLSTIYKVKSSKLPKKGGLYVFWWDLKSDLLTKNISKHKHLLKGTRSESELVVVQFSNTWIEMATTNSKLCLYVGKSTNLNQRIGKHVKPDTKNIWGNLPYNTGKKPNTESQLRTGIERILECNDAREQMFDNITVTYIELDGIENCVNRFYLEDFLVGTYFPIFNIDIER